MIPRTLELTGNQDSQGPVTLGFRVEGGNYYATVDIPATDFNLHQRFTGRVERDIDKWSIVSADQIRGVRPTPTQSPYCYNLILPFCINMLSLYPVQVSESQDCSNV